MDDLTSSFIVIGVTGVVVAAIFFFTHRAKDLNQQEIQEMAVSHGWQYTNISERLAWGTQLKAKTWEVVARSESIGQASDSGSSNIQSDTRFSAKWINPPAYELLIGPRSSGSSTGLYLPPENAGLREVTPEPAGLPPGYICLSDGRVDPAVLPGSAILRQLTEWPVSNRPLISIKPSSLEITITGYRMEKPVEFERFVRLGETILSVVEQ